MKICKITDLARDRMLIGYLFYYEKSGAFIIELSDGLMLKDSPIFFDAFIEKGRYTIDSGWSMKWVESRIVPRDRQNLGDILADNGLKEYDEYRLLMLAEGRCSQDDLTVAPASYDNLPDWLRWRMSGRLEFVKALDPWEVLLIYRDGSIWRTDVGDLLKGNADLGRILTRPDRHGDVHMMAGGSGIEWTNGIFLMADELRGRGVRLPLEREELDRVISSYVVDTADVCYEFDCSRQYVSRMVRENALEEFKTTGGTRLFTRADVDRARE